MISKGKNAPISGGKGQFRPTPNVLSDAAATSSDAQKLVRASESPFQNRQGAAQIPAPAHPYYKTGSNFAKQGLRYGGVPKRVGAANTGETNYAASGDRKPGGYKGNPIITGRPTSGGQRIAGDGNFPKAIKTKASGRMRTNLDIFSPRVLHEAGLTKL